MSGRNIHFSNSSLFFSFLITGAVLLFVPASITSKLSLAFREVFEPVLRIGREVQRDAVRMQPGTDESVALAEYTHLWKNYNNLHAQLLALHAENERLSNLRTGLPSSFAGFVPARIVGTVGNYSHEVIINKGSKANVRPGQFVLSELSESLEDVIEGLPISCSLIGVVQEVTEKAARIRLITDAKQSIEVRIGRQGTDKDIGAMMFGDDGAGCKIPMLDKEQDIRIGDTVYAAEVPGKLDVPLVIGEVVDVHADDRHPLLWDVSVVPAETMGRLDKVTVIVADEMLLKTD